MTKTIVAIILCAMTLQAAQAKSFFLRHPFLTAGVAIAGYKVYQHHKKQKAIEATQTSTETRANYVNTAALTGNNQNFSNHYLGNPNVNNVASNTNRPNVAAEQGNTLATNNSNSRHLNLNWRSLLNNDNSDEHTQKSYAENQNASTVEHDIYASPPMQAHGLIQMQPQ